MEMSKQLENIEVKDYIRALQARMLRHSVGELPTEIDPRTALIALKNGLFAHPGKDSFPDKVLDILEDEHHKKRAVGMGGPLFFYREDERTRRYFWLDQIVLHPEVRARSAALNELDRRIRQFERFLNPETETRLNELRELAVRDNSAPALSAAVEIADRLNDDYFYQIAGARQCASLHAFDELPELLHRVLAPKESRLQFLMELPVWSPNRQGKAIQRMLKQMVETAETLHELLDAYFLRFGHLPLTGQASAGAVVRDWKANHEFQDDPWQHVWDWATRNGSPLARYHACQLLCHNPEWVGEDRYSAFANECAQIIRGASMPTAWNRRCDLARHYSRHLELLCPGADAERTAAFAWWLTEYLHASLDSFGAEARDRCNAIIDEACRISDEVWMIVRPPTTRSSLRYATQFSANLWATSILAELSGSELLQIFDGSSGARSTVATALSKPSFVGLGRADRDSPDFSFECPTLPLMRRMVDLDVDESVATTLQRNVDVLTRIREKDELIDLLKAFPTLEPNEAKLIAHELRLSSFEGTVPLDAFWDLLFNEDWRKRVLVDADEQSVEMLLSAAIEIELSDSSHDWESYLPHILALVTEEAFEDDARQRLLFAYSVTTSLAVDSVSAIQRLLTSPSRRDYEDFVTKWRERIERATPISPAWVAARLRGLKSVLHL